MEHTEQLAVPPLAGVKTMARWKKAVAGLALATVSFVGFMGFLHTKPGLPLRAIIFGDACPVGNFNSKELEPQITAAAAANRGEGRAPSLAHVGFTLGKTKLADAEAWAKSKGLSCANQRQSTLFTCAKVPAAALGRPVTDGDCEVNLLFRLEDGTLYNMEVYHLGVPATVAATIFDRVNGEWKALLGAPTVDSAKAKPVATTSLGETTRYAFSDAVYEISYVNVAGNVAVNEHVLRPDLATKP
jgi:hypothetical protein